MQLNAEKLAIATATIVAISWVLCSLLIIALPGPMQHATGAMIHSEMMNWQMSWTGFATGLVLWSAISGAYVWAIAVLYNRLVK